MVEVKGDGDKESARGLRRFIASTGYKRLELTTYGELASVEVARKTKEISEAEIVPKQFANIRPNSERSGRKSGAGVQRAVASDEIGIEA